MSILIFGIYLLLTLLAFGKLPLTFFQQDEWAIFGNYIYWDKAGLNWWNRLFLYEQDTHIIPFGNLVSYMQFKLFGLSFFPYGVFNMALHLGNALLVYLLAFLLTKKRSISFLAGLFFLVNSIPHQAVTWTATTIGTAGSTFFVLLTVIFFTKYLIDSEVRRRYLFLSIAFLFLSLGFKETSVFVFLFLPVLWFFLAKKRSRYSSLMVFSPFMLLGSLYVLLRVYFLLFGYESTSAKEAISQPGLFEYLYRVGTLPLKFFSQEFVPQGFIISAAENLVNIAYPQLSVGGSPNPYIVESVGSDIVTYVLAGALLLFTFFFFRFFRKSKNNMLSITLLLSLIFITLSSLPLIFVPGKAGYFSLVDGRHLYVTSIFSSLLLSISLYGLYLWFPKRGLVMPIFLVLILSFIAFHGLRIRNDINQQVGIGFIRKSILNRITAQYPKLPQKVIFYVESDKSYYGLPESEKIPPFQSGFGQTLLVWYNSQYNSNGEDLPACMFSGKYLYVLLSEGYKECEGRVFGYFRKKENLERALKDHNLSPENVIGFSYNSSTNTLLDISKSLR